MKFKDVASLFVLTAYIQVFNFETDGVVYDGCVQNMYEGDVKFIIDKGNYEVICIQTSAFVRDLTIKPFFKVYIKKAGD